MNRQACDTDCPLAEGANCHQECVLGASPMDTAQNIDTVSINADPWPNGLGYDLRIGRRHYEIWQFAVREIGRDNLGKRYCKIATPPRDAQHAAEIVLEAVKLGKWSLCE